MWHAVNQPFYYKSHALRTGQRLIHLHRHVGDVLISEWWYKRKFFDDQRTLHDFVRDAGYGEGWRSHTNHFFPCNHSIAYQQLSSANAIASIVSPRYSISDIERAINKSAFAHLQKVEESGFGIYPAGNTDIKFIRDGRVGQWQELDEDLKSAILERNHVQLKMLGYLP